MPGLLPHVDPDGLLEYSVVYTDRALNHMAQRFQRVPCRTSSATRSYRCTARAAAVPGSGSFGMEAVARQFARQEGAGHPQRLVQLPLSQIFEMGSIPPDHGVEGASHGHRRRPTLFAPDRRSGGDDPRAKARLGVRAARRDLMPA